MFDAEPIPTVLGSAVLSDCERYRYLLGREWDDAKPTAVFVMLNPSTADVLRDDPTIRRCLGYARAWGCGALMVANLYAWRATDPAALWAVEDPVGPENDAHLYAAATIAAASGGPLVAAWGANARQDRIAAVLALPGMDRLSALALTKDGQPRHPLYLKADLTPQPWMQPAA
nr:DUF1643 domain-containing protein [Streptomyces cupreus]